MREPMTLVRETLEAHKRIRPYVRRTELIHSPHFSALTGANVFFKCENLQHTGSFKLRGALNKYLSLEPSLRKRGVVTASTGNHGKAVAYIAQELGGAVTIFAPRGADKAKLAAMKSLGAEVILSGADCIDAEAAAREHGARHRLMYIPPYNDPEVIAGQGTISVELCAQLDQIDAVFASVGGGGLISGVAAYLRSKFPGCEIVGCAPERSQVMFASMAAGTIVAMPSLDTLSDGTAGGIEPGSITFDFCRALITRCVTVSEGEIKAHLLAFREAHPMPIEGAAAVALAGLTQNPGPYRNKNVVVILCGANLVGDLDKRVVPEAMEKEC